MSTTSEVARDDSIRLGNQHVTRIDSDAGVHNAAWNSPSPIGDLPWVTQIDSHAGRQQYPEPATRMWAWAGGDVTQIWGAGGGGM